VQAGRLPGHVLSGGRQYTFTHPGPDLETPGIQSGRQLSINISWAKAGAGLADGMEIASYVSAVAVGLQACFHPCTALKTAVMATAFPGRYTPVDP